MTYEDVLTVSFDGELLNDKSADKSALCVARKRGDETTVVKTVLGDQANILYYLLTEQNANAEIKSWWKDKNKEQLILDRRTKQLLYELSKMSPMVISTAYAYAVNYTKYGEDVTKDWLTATQNAAALEKAYADGYHDAMQRLAESEEA